MKKLLCLLPLFALPLYAAGTTTNVTFYFRWPGPVDLGGLSTNDYMTNITFRLYSSTNASTPINQWQLYSAWQGSAFILQGPFNSQWSNTIPVEFTGARFFALKAYSPKASGGGESPFSAVDFILAPLPTGTIDNLK